MNTIFGAKLLSNVAGVVILFFTNPLDFHPKFLSTEPVNILKDLNID